MTAIGHRISFYICSALLSKTNADGCRLVLGMVFFVDDVRIAARTVKTMGADTAFWQPDTLNHVF